MLIYFSEFEKNDEKLINKRSCKYRLSEVYRSRPVLWREFKELIEEVEQEKENETG